MLLFVSNLFIFFIYFVIIKYNFKEYLMISLLANWTTDMWAPIIGLFSFIPNYAWSIIVFTIILKLVLSPLDFWQRKVQRDSTKKQQELQPLMEKLQKQYGNNKQMLNQKTMELYKKHNYNVVGSCVSMLVNFVLTMFIFFTLFYGLTGMSQDKIYNQYKDLQQNFYTEYSAAFAINNDADEVWAHYTSLLSAEEANARQALIDEGVTDPTAEQIFAKEQDLVLQNNTQLQDILNNEAQFYNEIKDGWLWIDSIWRPDTYVSGFPDYNTYKSSASITSRDYYKAVADSESLSDDEKNAIYQKWQNEYNLITHKIQTEHNSWNGYFILVILAALITYLSISISQRTSLKQNKAQAQAQPGAMRIMKFIMPLIMVFFTLSYSSAFAIYIVTNQIMSLLLSIVSMAIFNKKDKNNQDIVVKPKRIDVEYSR